MRNDLLRYQIPVYFHVREKLHNYTVRQMHSRQLHALSNPSQMPCRVSRFLLNVRNLNNASELTVRQLSAAREITVGGYMHVLTS